MSAVTASHNGSPSPRLHAHVRVKSQVRRLLSFRDPSLTFAGLRGKLCGHCADITNFTFLGRHPWLGSKFVSPTTATNGSWPATATPKAVNAPPAPIPVAALPN